MKTVKRVKISQSLTVASIKHNRLSKQLQIKTNQLEKWTKDIHTVFPEEVTKMANEQIERSSLQLLISWMQLKL